jgi:hypothetical protein
MAIWELLAPDLPHAFTWQYGADMTGLSKDRVGEAMKRLLDQGYLRACGKRQQGAKTLVLYKLVVPREPRQDKPLSDEDQRLIDEMEEQQNQRENDWINESRGGAANEYACPGAFETGNKMVSAE